MPKYTGPLTSEQREHIRKQRSAQQKINRQRAGKRKDLPFVSPDGTIEDFMDKLLALGHRQWEANELNYDS